MFININVYNFFLEIGKIFLGILNVNFVFFIIIIMNILKNFKTVVLVI